MLRCAKMINLGHGLWSPLIILLLLGGFRSGFAQGGAISSITTSAHKKSNQSKVFYHDTKWWAVAYDSVKASWMIWRFNNPGWVATKAVQLGADNSLDLVMDSATNKLYVISSHPSKSRFRRFSYSGGVWTLDPGFPVLFTGFINPNGNNPISLVKAKNGELWLFRVNGVNKLQIKVSTNNGTTWSANKNIKTLSQTNGTTDAVAFSDGINNYVGVGYAEVGSATSSFGFLRHRDGDPIASWTDESSSLTYFGTERAQNEIAMTVDGDNVVYMFTRTSGGTVGEPRNTLYQRSTTGVWTRFIVNAIGVRGWTSPALAIDSENHRLIVMGVNQNNNCAEYKAGMLGYGSDLQAAAISTLMQNGSDVFTNLSAPIQSVNAATGLMATAGDTTSNDTWYGLVNIPASVPVVVSSVVLSDSTVNTNARYTVMMTTSAIGALAANLSTISVRFPNNTIVPAVVTPGYIRVNGTPVSIASSNALTRDITLTTPVGIDTNASFTVVFSDTLGLLNPSDVGAHTLQAWTTQQTTPATSASYNLIAATTTVSLVKATLFPTDADSSSQYRVGFRVGIKGRLLSDSSKVTIHFANDTKIKSGALLGVTLNGINATAIGDTVNRRIQVKLPAIVTVNSSDSVTVFMPRTAITNPSRADTFRVQAATSAEPTPVSSNKFYTQKGRRIAGTCKNFDRGNQSKMFYHGGYWWLTAQVGSFWHLWKRSSTDTTWIQSTPIYNQGKSRPDCILDAPDNKVYILLPGSNTAVITRLSFAAGNWTVDIGFPRTVSLVQEKRMNLARAANGELWVFWFADSTLFARVSTDAGVNWSSDILVKAHLHSDVGQQDAVAYSNDFIGVGYAEDDESGSTAYGFLRHQNGADPTTWTDESASVPQFGTNSDDHMSMLAYNGEVFMLVKTAGGGNNTAHDGLLHRNSGGVWNAYSVNNGEGWTRPALALDETNSRLFAFGTSESDSVQCIVGKSVSLGSYDSFVDAPIDTFMHSRVDNFIDVSAPAHTVTGTSDLLIGAANDTRSEIWVQYISLPGGVVVAKSQSQPEDGASPVTAAASNQDLVVGAFPNPMNPSTQIQFTLKAAAPVKLQIFNINGQLVKTLVDNDLPAGTHRRMWRGTNQEGHIVSSGTYFYRLQVGGVMKTGQLYMIK